MDALRGYAILAVIIYHTYQKFPQLSPRLQKYLDFGSNGVQLFFMISAFTIFLTLNNDFKKGNGKGIFFAFYLRRFFRIAPLFYLTLIFMVFFSEKYIGQNMVIPFFGTLTFISTWIPSLSATLVPGGWSIAVEMWFYLLAPVLVAKIRNLNQALYFVFGTVIFRLIINEGLLHFLKNKPPEFLSYIYFWLPNQMPLFALGIVIYFLYQRINDVNRIETNISKPISPLFYFYAGLYLWAANLQAFKALLPFHFLLGVANVLIIIFIMRKPDNILLNKPIIGLGKISYSAYITHFFVIEYSYNYFTRITFGLNAQTLLVYVLFLLMTILITTITSTVLYFGIEKPSQSFGKKLIQKWKLIPLI